MFFNKFGFMRRDSEYDSQYACDQAGVGFPDDFTVLVKRRLRLDHTTISTCFAKAQRAK